MVKKHAPATDRNREPILAVLSRVFGEPGEVVEIAAGTGQHAAFFAKALPRLVWRPTDRTDEDFASIEAWAAEASAPNLSPPLVLDVIGSAWNVERADYVFCANMIHIAPREAMLGLLRGAARILPAGGKLVLYGPYKVGGQHTAPSNEAFDESLRSRDPRWGVRDLEDLIDEAAKLGLVHEETVEMPANNLTVVLRRGSVG